MILLLDNYDSFSFILKDYLQQCGHEVMVQENNDPIETIVSQDFTHIVFSPGPKTPRESGCLMSLVEYCAAKRIPALGVCLGHQALGEYFGARLTKAIKPMHGKICTIKHTQHDMFQNIPVQYDVCRYHSLILQDLENTPLYSIAETSDHEIMAIAHKEIPMWGVQFHPEAILTNYGILLLKNWLAFCH